MERVKALKEIQNTDPRLWPGRLIRSSSTIWILAEVVLLHLRHPPMPHLHICWYWD